MKKYILTILTVLLFIGCGGESLDEFNQNLKSVAKNAKVTHTTPQGVKVKQLKGANNAARMLTAIDNGISASIAKFQCEGYDITKLKHSEITVVIVPSIMFTSNEGNQYPVYKLPVGQYKGTPFDKGGYIVIAGQYFDDSGIIALPDNTTTNLNYTRDGADFEMEHKGLHQLHLHRFGTTALHLNGGHPILKCGESLVTSNLPSDILF